MGSDRQLPIVVRDVDLPTADEVRPLPIGGQIEVHQMLLIGVVEHSIISVHARVIGLPTVEDNNLGKRVRGAPKKIESDGAIEGTASEAPTNCSQLDTIIGGDSGRLCLLRDTKRAI